MPASKKSTYQVFVITSLNQKHQVSSEMYNKAEAFKIKRSWLQKFPLDVVEVYKIEKI